MNQLKRLEQKQKSRTTKSYKKTLRAIYRAGQANRITEKEIQYFLRKNLRAKSPKERNQIRQEILGNYPVGRTISPERLKKQKIKTIIYYSMNSLIFVALLFGTIWESV